MTRQLIPLPVAAIVNDVIPGSHAMSDALYRRAGASGEPPALSHAAKWKMWLLQTNNDPSVQPLTVLGRIIEEFMEVEPAISTPAAENYVADRQRLEDVLQRYNLRYRAGGRIVTIAASPASSALKVTLEQHDFQGIEIEFERALQSVEADPGAAVTAASSLLEALFKSYIEQRGLAMPDNQSIKPLWSAVQKDLGLDPKDQTDQDIQRVLSGITSLVDGTRL